MAREWRVESPLKCVAERASLCKRNDVMAMVARKRQNADGALMELLLRYSSLMNKLQGSKGQYCNI